MKKIRKDILAPLIVTVVGGMILTIWQLWVNYVSEEKPMKVEQQVSKSSQPNSIGINLDEFYVLGDFDKAMMESEDSVDWYYYFGIQESVFKGNMLLDNYTGNKSKAKKDSNYYRTRYVSLQSLAKLSGLNPHNTEVQQHDSVEDYLYNAQISDGFTYYNPDIILWIADNFIPDPEVENMNGFLFQRIYDRRIKRSARLLAESYYHFPDDRSYKNAQREYMKAMKSDGFFGPDYLNKKYLRPQESPVNFSYATCVGFWLRRGIDGTNDEVWQSIRKLLILYDKEWFSTYNNPSLNMY